MTAVDGDTVKASNGSLQHHGKPAVAIKPKGWGARHTLCLLGFWAFAISYAMRFNLSIAIVAMVNNTKPVESAAHHNHHVGNSSLIVEHEEACVHLKTPPRVDEHGVTENLDPHGQGEFHWNLAEQGVILGSFFWGYVLTQFPGGLLATKYGGKWTLGLGLFVTAIFAILTPMLARTHIYLLVLARVIQGLGEGVTTPAMHAIIAAWAPPEERSMMGSIVYAGAQFGTAVTMVVSGYLIHAGVWGGWPSVFYFIGAFSLLWFILWTMFMYDTPASHPRISDEELMYIQKSSSSRKETSHEPTV
ncbi:putative inorganic phosphate cotransporter [Orchesella cincta]|uniref:Putative inorganic phosphate cotransporter n=1 Tax=Orchesella cincta TaxID=48709 RepID=A0A1D2NDR3_ORCCI|nr:putative inorganic phosphate cotransporter [Orchesella cincta]